MAERGDEGGRPSDAVSLGKLGRTGYRWQARGDRVVIEKQLRRLFAVLVGAWLLYSLVLAFANKLDVRLVSVLLLAPLLALLCERARSFWLKVPSRLQASPEGLVIGYPLRRPDFLPGPIVYSMASKDLGGVLPYTEYEVVATAADGRKRTLVKAVSTDVDAAEMSPLLESLNRSTRVGAVTGESALGTAHTEMASWPSTMAWIRHLRSIGSGANVGPRTAPVSAEQLWQTVEAPTAEPAAREAAAVALSGGLDGEGRRRLRIAAQQTVQPNLRVVFDAAADEDVDEAKLERAVLRARASRRNRRRHDSPRPPS
jgi:hypothetical protein